MNSETFLDNEAIELKLTRMEAAFNFRRDIKNQSSLLFEKHKMIIDSKEIKQGQSFRRDLIKSSFESIVIPNELIDELELSELEKDSIGHKVEECEDKRPVSLYKVYSAIYGCESERMYAEIRAKVKRRMQDTNASVEYLQALAFLIDDSCIILRHSKPYASLQASGYCQICYRIARPATDLSSRSNHRYCDKHLSPNLRKAGVRQLRGALARLPVSQDTSENLTEEVFRLWREYGHQVKRRAHGTTEYIEALSRVDITASELVSGVWRPYANSLLDLFEFYAVAAKRYELPDPSGSQYMGLASWLEDVGALFEDKYLAENVMNAPMNLADYFFSIEVYLVGIRPKPSKHQLKALISDIKSEREGVSARQMSDILANEYFIDVGKSTLAKIM